MADARRRLLIGLVAGLALIRFGVVPWIAAQNQQRDALEVLTRRLDRSEGVVKNRAAIESASQQLAARARALRERFPAAASPDQFRLAEQRRIGELARQLGLTVQVFDWILEGEDTAAGLHFGRARVNLDGALPKLIRAHVALESATQNAFVRELRLNLDRPADGPSEVHGSASVVVDLYFRLVKA